MNEKVEFIDSYEYEALKGSRRIGGPNDVNENDEIDENDPEVS